MSRLVLCTTGTSIAPPPDRGDKAAIRRRLEELSDQCADDRELLKKASAETKSLLALKASPDDKIFLLHTDTDDGLACAEMVSWLASEKLGLDSELIRIAGLQVRDAAGFRRDGVPNLFRALDRLCHEWPRDRVVLNCTGGFKGVVPFIAIYGAMNKLETVYIFEFSDALITLPPLPVSFDHEIIRRAFPALEKIDRNTAISEKDYLANIEGYQHFEREEFMSLVERVGDQYTMGPLALMLWEDMRAKEGNVFISASAAEALEQADGNKSRRFQEMLRKARNPLWRRQHLHAFSGTDLEVYKPGNTAERLAGFRQGSDFYACELLIHGFDYDKRLAARRRKDYGPTEFTLWTDTPDAEPEYTPFEKLEAEKLALDHKLAESDRLLGDAKAKQEAAVHRLDDARAKLEAKEKAAGRLESERDGLKALIKQVESQHERERDESRRDLERLSQEMADLRAENASLRKHDYRLIGVLEFLRRRIAG